jgi:ABC-2 type transport system ATP-binding protein
MAVVETHGLAKEYGSVTAVQDLSLEVEEGEVLGFLGPNGAGKTTTIRMLAGIIAPTAGYALVDGLNPSSAPEAVHETIGLLTESPGFYSRLSARRNLEYFAGFYPGLDVPAQVEKYLKAMDLWDRKEDKVGTFSKGMKQRLALARAMLHEPRVLFLDEPTAGLDPEAGQEVRRIVKNLSLEGRTIFLCTHNLAEAEVLCRRIAIVRTRLLALDTPQNLRQRVFRREVVVELQQVDSLVIEAVRSLAYVKNFRQEGNRLVVELAQPERSQPDLVECVVKSGGRVLTVRERSHPLEEVYLRLVRQGAGSDS